MGVRGLTTFINQRAHQCYEDYQLKDCQLVIDGSSLASQLYLSKNSFNSAFGGDYDRYALSIREFFKLLKKCRVSPIVILDGGYEKRKLKTTFSRLKQKWRLMKNLTPGYQLGNNVFPCFLKDTFKAVLKELKVPFAQCLFEADEEIAAVAKVLNCPVLSYDSDFFVFNVLYIPFPTLNLYACKDNSENAKKDDYFLRCSLYRMEMFLKQFGGLDKELLPLFAVLLGNDYISNRVFRSFMKQFKHQKGKTNRKQKKIVGLLQWLQGETFESAFLKLSNFIRKYKRKPITTKIKKEVSNYITAPCSLLSILGIEEVPRASDAMDKLFAFLEEKEEDEEGREGKEEEEEEGIGGKEKGEEGGGGGGIEKEEELEILDDDSEGEASSQEETDEEDTDDEETFDDDNEEEIGESNEERECGDEETEGNEKKHGKRPTTWEHRVAARLPQWFLERFQRGDLPSAFMDVIVLRTLFSPAQMEDWSLPPAHATAEAAVRQLVSLLLMRGPGGEALAWQQKQQQRLRRRSEVRWLLRGDAKQKRQKDGGDHHQEPRRWVSAPSCFASSPVPPLHALPSLPLARRLRLLLEPAVGGGGGAGVPVGVAEAAERAVAQLPPRWRLLAVSVAAWRSSADPPPLPHHLDALLLSLLLLDVVASHFSVSCAGRRPRRRAKAKALVPAQLKLTPLETQAEDSSHNDVKEPELPEKDGVEAEADEEEEECGAVERALRAVRSAECDAALQTLRPFCVMEERLKTRPKLFCAATVHAFAQWQSALLHLAHLNALLGWPLPDDCPVHRVFNGTFAYNVAQHLRGKRGAGDSAAAVARLLHKAPSLLALFQTLRTAMHAVAPELRPTEPDKPEGSQSVKSCVSRRKKWKRKKANQVLSTTHVDSPPSPDTEDSGADFEDPCNRFSSLNISR